MGENYTNTMSNGEQHGEYTNGASHGRVQQPWVTAGTTSEAFTQGFEMFDGHSDNPDNFGNTHRRMEVSRVSDEAKAIKQKQRTGGCPYLNPEEAVANQSSSPASTARGNIHNPARLNVYKQSMGEQRHTSCANHVTTAEDTTNNYKDAVKMRNDNLQKQRGNSNLLSFDE